MTPDEYTIQELTLPVTDGHALYVQEWGNKEANTTFIFLHGGPGSGCSDKHKQNFNPKTQRVVFFDQRGCGKSMPYGSLQANTTEEQIADINAIANKLDIDTFVLVGGSWGSCLALAYGLAHPERVSAMVLRGIFTGSKQEVDFIEQGGFQDFFPDVWQQFMERTPKEYRDNPAAYHEPRTLGDDPVAAKKSAYAFSELEGSLVPLDDRHTPDDFDTFDPTSTRIEIHYTANLCFMPDRYILENARKLTMPIWIVQGRYDAVCPPSTAFELHEKLPSSELIWTLAGHSGGDRANMDTIKAIITALA